ncbi:SPOR domain-containing protein [Colwellia sp. C1TZA3]|uniref:SPOR domain-containing protein n=1 Tax=Colwellia sp. C1TZA3 TaxID=2508879 RepID=UPI0011B9F7BE|nr:SPOR domain-containing protein [Colwellia sp. C1TZA3]TWX67482.1 SPOR domain-containing protein [Colwellia sp. C1TZA3]
MKFIILCFCLLAFNCLAAVALKKISLSDDDFVLFSLRLNDQAINHSIDSFLVDGELFLAIEPLLDSLKVKYQLTGQKLLIWKNDTVNEFILSEQSLGLPSKNLIVAWGDDGFYSYIAADVINQLFATDIISDTRTLQVVIKTSDYAFPLQTLQQLEKIRQQEQLSGYYIQSKGAKAPQKQLEITIPDQYRLITMPIGTFTANVEINENNNRSIIQANFVSDLLYHSAIVNLNKQGNETLRGGVALSRYKTSPDDLILGAFDGYRFGDIASIGDATSLSQTGLGIGFERRQAGYRNQNTAITLTEYATPGWEAELYHNNRFISSVIVPETGLLLYKDLDIYYGKNEFVIKLYGPFGEADQIRNNYNLKANPLANGEFSYGVYALDPSNSVLNDTLFDQSESTPFSLSNIGGNIDYGVNDIWQIGLSYTHRNSTRLQEGLTEDEFVQDAITLKNYFSLPGLLFENNLSLNDNGGYLQKTSLTGRAIYDGNFNIIYESAKAYRNESTTFSNSDFENVQVNYNNHIAGIPISIFYRNRKTNKSDTASLGSRVSYNFGDIYASHTLRYSQTKLEVSELNEFSDNKLTGSLSVSGGIIPSLRIIGDIQYEPSKSNPILKNSKVSLSYTLEDGYNFQHYFRMGYRPLLDKNKWEISHNVGINVNQFQFGILSRYQDGGHWNVNANIQFFFGYDYYNNRALFNSKLYRNSASLNLHAYLDRHMNGVYDALDYNLSGVTIPNLQDWNTLATGKNGRAIIPGLPMNNVFKFDANWKNGAQTIGKNYVLYTHPGARVDVNMPFYLSTEFSGFISILRREEKIGARNLTIDLIGVDERIIESVKTDEDGYYEFYNIEPDDYTIRINSASLRDNGLSSDVIGFNIESPIIGGYTELPGILVQKTNEIMQENIILMSISADDVEQLVWDEDAKERQNYFNMPTKSQVVVDPNLAPPSANERINIEAILAIKKSKLIELKKAKKVRLKKKKLKIDVLTKPGFIIQLGAFLSLEQAKTFKDNLSKTLETPLLLNESKNSKEQVFYTVEFGGYRTKAEAEKAIKQLGLNSNQYMIKTMDIADIPVSVLAPLSDLAPVSIINPLASDFTPSIDDVIRRDNGWVIQFAAYKTQAMANSESVLIKMPNIYVAQKTLRNTTYYCLVSDIFNTKEAAKNALKDRDGWIVQSKNFTKITLSQ